MQVLTGSNYCPSYPTSTYGVSGVGPLNGAEPITRDNQISAVEQVYTVDTWDRQGTKITLRVVVQEQLLRGEITYPGKNPLLLDPSQIKCGIYVDIPHPVFIKTIQKFQNGVQDHIAAYCYSYEAKTEIWVFEAKKVAAIWIKQAKITLYQLDLKNNKDIHSYDDILKNLQTAWNTQKRDNGDVSELDLTIKKIKNEKFQKNIELDLPIYLSMEERPKFSKIIECYRESCADGEDVSPYLFKHVETLEKSALQPHENYFAAWMYENKQNVSKAMHYYRELSVQNINPASCLKKIQSLVEKGVYLDFLESLDYCWLIERRNTTNDPFLETLILQKDVIRMIFENHLKDLRVHTKQEKPPSCFICFNVEEKDVEKWLEHTLASDLDKVKIKVIACFRDFGLGKRIIGFEERICDTDLAIIACTPSLKKKCDERHDAPFGVAQEVQLAETRINTSKLHEKTFFLYLKGSRDESRPSKAFKDYLHITLNKVDVEGVYHYYEQAFELFGSMLNIDREISRKAKEAFTTAANKALDSGDINIFKLEEWRKNVRFSRNASF